MNLNKFKKGILYLLIITVFSVPRTLQPIKIGMLFILLLCFLVENRYKKSVFILGGTYGLLFLFPLIVGLLFQNQYNYILNVIRINFFFPLLLLLIFQQFDLHQLQKIIEKGALISIIVIFLIFLSSVLNAFGFFPYNINQYFYPQEAFVGIHDGYLHVVNSSLSYLIFLIPLYFLGEKFSLKTPKTYFFFIMLIVSIISGRRILLLPFILITLLNLKRVILPMIVILILAFLLVNKDVYADFKLDKIVNRFKDALEDSGDSEVRGEQSAYFLKYIKERPVTGYGLGSYMPDYIRSIEMPFAYEKTWDYQIFSMGIPTTIFHIAYYFMLIFLVFKNNKSIEVTYKRFKNALILSILSILIASNTNPYWLSSFDYCLPLALLFRFSQQEYMSENHVLNLNIR